MVDKAKSTQSVAAARAGFEQVNDDARLRETALRALEEWLTDERFRDYRPLLEDLLDRGDYNTLFDAFFRQIPFGTGGRRGPVGVGTNRFNPFTLSTSIQGHCEFLRGRFDRADDLAVVVAFDVRSFDDLRRVYRRDDNVLLGLSSKDFARIAASVYAANGIRVWMPDPDSDTFISTPELSFAIIRQRAHGGLNVSASHNHPDDNGAKIYNDRGGQEVPPVDEELAKIVERTFSARTMPFARAVDDGLIRFLPADVHEAYVEMNRRVSRQPSARSARVVFTPLHGTGYHSAGAALERAGFDVDLYPDQATPDGAFPNVPFRSPNPEVRQSLDGAREYARRRGADLVLGTDPDADRIGMLAPVGADWRFYSGNQIGVVLVHYLLSCTDLTARRRRPIALTTLVTTSLFTRIAAASGLQVINDLGVGFKYIAEVLNHLETEGRFRHLEGGTDDFLIAIEESHGYLVVPSVRDKDAAGAAVLLAEIASVLKDEGRTFQDYLDGIYREYGYVSNILVSTVMQGATGFDRMQKIQASLRRDPPTEIGGRSVDSVEDRWDESGPLGPIRSETDRASRDVLTYGLAGGARLTLRPSGTEPKNKIYVEVGREPLGESATDQELAREKDETDGEARRLARSFTQSMLSRVKIEVPDYALEVSDLVALEWKADFAERFVPELRERLLRGEDRARLESWADERLAKYGADGRLLVREAIASCLRGGQLPQSHASLVRQIFGL